MSYDPEHRWTNDGNMVYWERRARRAEDALRHIAVGDWNHGNRVPGLTVMRYARNALEAVKL